MNLALKVEWEDGYVENRVFGVREDHPISPRASYNRNGMMPISIDVYPHTGSLECKNIHYIIDTLYVFLAKSMIFKDVLKYESNELKKHLVGMFNG